MPITKSAKKALRVSARRRAHNLVHKNRVRLLRREISKLLLASKVKEAQAKLPQLYKFLDKAAKENVIKRNTAARLKSRISKSISKVQVKPS